MDVGDCDWDFECNSKDSKFVCECMEGYTSLPLTNVCMLTDKDIFDEE